MKILFIGNNWLGDAVMSLPAINAIKKQLNAEIFILTKSYISELYSLFDWIDTIIPYEDVKSIKKTQFDYTVIFPRSLSAIFKALSIKSKNRVGFSGGGRSLFLTRKIPRNLYIQYHRVDYFYKLGEIIGVNSVPALPQVPIIPSCQLISDPSRCVIFCAGAKYGDAKMWPTDYYKELAKLISTNLGFKIIAVGSAEESRIGEQICDGISNSINLCGKTSIKDLICLFQNSKLLVTNDTGPMHLASLTTIPIIPIFGPTDHTTTSPYRKENVKLIKRDIECSPCLERTCPLKHHKCMTNIPVEEVFTTVLKLLN